MRKRQPHRADLSPPRCEAIDDPPRDDEVRLGIVVREDEPFVQVEGPGAEPDEQRNHGEQPLRVSCAGYNHWAA